MLSSEPPEPTTAERLTEALPPALRPFILIDSVTMLPAITAEVGAALAEAGRLIGAVIRPDRTCNLVFATAPFRLTLGNGELVFTPRDDVVQARVNSIIFIDVAQLISHESPYRVAMLLEEFVHVLMHIEDETFVMAVVSDLYAGISVVDGKYKATGV